MLRGMADEARSAEAEELNLTDALVQSSFLVQGVLRRVAARHDLSVVQMRLLGILRDREPGTLALAAYLELDKSSVTGLVDRAEKRGLVERVADPDDGRAVRIRADPRRARPRHPRRRRGRRGAGGGRRGPHRPAATPTRRPAQPDCEPPGPPSRL